MKTLRNKISYNTLFLIFTAALLILAEFLAASPSLITPTERLDFAARDAAMRLRGPQPVDERIVIVAIDDFSFNWTGYAWPWPRTYFAEIVRALNDAEAKVIGLDVTLFEEKTESDRILAQALEETPIAVNVMQIYTDHQGVKSVRLPQPIYRDVFDSIGVTPILLDDDAIARSLIAQESYLDQTYFNWAIEIARLYQGAPPITEYAPDAFTLNEEIIPLQNNRLLVNFHGQAGSYPTYSAAQVVLGDYPAENFKDKIVLIGATTLTLQDIYSTPFSSQIRTSGVEIVANAVDSLLNQDYLRVAPFGVSVLLILFAALASRLIIRSPRPALTISLLIGSVFLYGFVYYLAFRYAGYYLPFMAPQTMLIFGVIFPTLGEAVSQEIEKRRVRQLFSRFISPEMVEQLINTQDVASLNKRSEITILFADIRNFTTLSERLNPEEVVNLLNPFLARMTKVIHKHGGTVDKYEGDAILAFFGEPVRHEDHALRAARTARDMRLALVKLIEEWEKKGILPPNFTFDIGIGLNSGEVFVGLLGSEERVNYTVIGDNVNLAARLQDLSKNYNSAIIISESTQQAIKNEFETKFIDSVRVKGRRETVNIYALLNRW